MPDAGRYVLCVGLTPAIQRILEFSVFRPGEVNRAVAVKETTGGKGPNVAKALRRLGTPCCLTGFNGGEAGRRFKAYLAEEGVECAFAETSAPTRVCQTIICRETLQVTELVEEAPMPTADEWSALMRLFDRLLERASFVTISGNLQAGVDAKTYDLLLAKAAARKVPALIDSSVRPLLDALGREPAVAKLNVHELEITFGETAHGEGRVVALARRLLEKGARSAVVTHGERGAWLVEPGQTLHFTPPRVKPLNPIGSGDAVAAGIAHALVRGLPLRDAVRLGVACGTANAMTLAPCDFDPREAERLMEQVAVRS
jgi:tagatose 6-phosphate kinase